MPEAPIVHRVFRSYAVLAREFIYIYLPLISKYKTASLNRRFNVATPKIDEKLNQAPQQEHPPPSYNKNQFELLSVLPARNIL